MINVHILGLNKKEASDVEQRIFNAVECYDKGKCCLEYTFVTVHEKTVTHNHKGENRPRIIITGNYPVDLRNIAKRLIILEMDIEILKIQSFYPAKSCR